MRYLTWLALMWVGSALWFGGWPSGGFLALCVANCILAGVLAAEAEEEDEVQP